MYSYSPDNIREIDHTADIGLHADGNTLPELYANLAFGMIHIIAGDVEVCENNFLHIEIDEKSETDLIVSWLSEINYHLSVHHFLPSVINKLIIHTTDDGILLEADLGGVNILNQTIELKTEIKAITYHQLKFEKTEHGYLSQVIFDI